MLAFVNNLSFGELLAIAILCAAFWVSSERLDLAKRGKNDPGSR